MSIVYVAMSADVLHRGHINLLREAASHGEVTVGLLTDNAIREYKDPPLLPYDERWSVLRAICFVRDIIPQHRHSYLDNLNFLEPKYVVHGDDWCEGPQKHVRDEVVAWCEENDATLIEVPYTSGISSSVLKAGVREMGFSPSARRPKIYDALRFNRPLKIVEAHSGISAKLVEDANVANGLWLSSLTDSLRRGRPDDESVDFSERLETIREIFRVSTLPLIIDMDSGGPTDTIGHRIFALDNMGVSAAIIEDKMGAKRNSMFGQNAPVKQTQMPISDFCEKIKKAVEGRVHRDFLVIARIESLVLQNGVDAHVDVVKRARAYYRAGADAVFISCKGTSFVDGKMKILRDCVRNLRVSGIPVFLAPHGYDFATFEELTKTHMEANAVIYANQLMRCAISGMRRAINEIKNGSAHIVDAADLKEVISLI